MSVNEQSNESQGTETDQGGEGLGSLSDLEQLGAALAEDEQQPGGGDGESSGSEKTKPTKFNDLAGATDLDLDALYALEVQLDDDGEPVTVEQLKDHYKQRADFDVERLAFEEQRTQQTNELLRERNELQELLQALPANAVKPEVLKKLRDRMDRTAQEERAATLKVIPTWSDKEARTADIEAMAKHLQDYGFPANQLEQMVDHRWLRYVRESMLREQRIRKALEKVRKGAPPKGKTSKPNGKAPKKNAAPVIKPKSGQSKLEAFLTNTD